MNIDERIVQCKTDIARLQENLKELEAKKKPTMFQWGQKFTLKGYNRLFMLVRYNINAGGIVCLDTGEEFFGWGGIKVCDKYYITEDELNIMSRGKYYRGELRLLED